MRNKNKTFPIYREIDGMELTEAVTTYLSAQFPDAEIEKRFENNTYGISFVQNANLKKVEKVTPSQSKIMCFLISIRLMNGLCNVDIQSEAFTPTRKGSKERLMNAALCVGTLGAAIAFPGIMPYAMSALVGASIVAAANSTERKVFDFIKNYIS